MPRRKGGTGNGGGKGSYGSDYYESSGMPETGMGRRKTRKVPKGMLGSGLAEGTANKLRSRKRFLESL